ncbi:alkylation response protein AidB-like acyl-CoA dehydrogenase [Fontibacillus phaseoli]|uniref:Alkylation response protein AidB-like acyl-CoA dehydrogenase n=1 Tax=Fontibacillus phaseoli TaxID=1416533 RepID=A0A369BAN2_9BACL|nr:acyl-CoA dehydrogenase family protein [Fontibacillus phaseoli]RCX18589.1 alkylation response protein AidB-like acyl-CoA dehydrogenase [Fontibacillus phaseoli]
MPSDRHGPATTDKQQEWLARLDAVLEQNAAETEKADVENDLNYGLISDLKRIGYPALAVPSDLGGGGLSLTDFLAFQERIAQADAATALAIGWHMSTVLQLGAVRPWRTTDFESLCGEILGSSALINRADSEGATGSPSRGGVPQTTARRTPDGYSITGTKRFTSLAPVLDYFIVSAFEPETGGVSDFLIPKGTQGLSIDRTWNTVGMRGTGSHDLVLRDAEVPFSAKVIERKHSKVFQPNPFILFIPAVYLGIAEAARDEAVRFARSYQPNSLNHPITSLPNIQQTLGQIELEILAARHFLYSVAGKYENQEFDSVQGWDGDFGAAKVLAVQNALSVVDKAMRIVGIHGLSLSHPLQRLYRDVRFGLHNPPMEDAVLRQLAVRALESKGTAHD